MPMRQSAQRCLCIFLLLLFACNERRGAPASTTSSTTESSVTPKVSVETTSAIAPLPRPTETDPLLITDPVNGANVCHQPIIKGRVFDHQTDVVLIVKAMKTGTCYVQPTVDKSSDGTWDVQSFVGHTIDENNGEHFKIMAIGNPSETLERGKELPDWPEGKYRSNMIEVIRTKCP